MKNLKDFLLESSEDNSSNDKVYVLYYDDGTMHNYYNSKEEANEEIEKLKTENSDFVPTIKEEPKSNFEN